jgi:hypothetical protein
MTNVPSVKERIDPNSPHYDPEFVKLREAAYKAHFGHKADLKKSRGKRVLSHFDRNGKAVTVLVPNK